MKLPYLLQIILLLLGGSPVSAASSVASAPPLGDTSEIRQIVTSDLLRTVTQQLGDTINIIMPASATELARIHRILEKDKSVRVCYVQITSLKQSGDKAEVFGNFQWAPLGGQGYRYVLLKDHGVWKIQKRTLDIVS